MKVILSLVTIPTCLYVSVTWWLSCKYQPFSYALLFKIKSVDSSAETVYSDKSLCDRKLKTCWNVLLPDSPDLTLSDFHFFTPFEEASLKTKELHSWLGESGSSLLAQRLTKEFCADGIQRLVAKWENVL